MEKGSENWQLQINIDTYRILFLNASCSLNQRMMLLGDVFCFVFFSYLITVTHYLLENMRHCCIYMYVCCIFFQLKVCNRQSSAHFLLSWPGELQKVKSNTAIVMWRQGNRHKKIRKKMCLYPLLKLSSVITLKPTLRSIDIDSKYWRVPRLLTFCLLYRKKKKKTFWLKYKNMLLFLHVFFFFVFFKDILHCSRLNTMGFEEPCHFGPSTMLNNHGIGRTDKKGF